MEPRPASRGPAASSPAIQIPARWFYQSVSHDLYDYDGINELVLLDLPMGEEVRKVVVRPERNGYLYVLDRATGEVLSVDPFFRHINSTTGVDLETGRLIYNPEKHPTLGKVVRGICPTAPGAKDWNLSAFSPRTGLLYIPHMNLCMDWESIEVNYIAGTPYVGANVKMFAGPGGNRGELTAWDPAKRTAAWRIEEDLPLWSPALATAGDLVFYGTMDGWFKALDARAGETLWQFKTGSGIIGQPPSVTVSPTVASTSPLPRASAAGRVPSSPVRLTPAMLPRPRASSARCPISPRGPQRGHDL